jgi:hypothetical protein
VAGCIASGLFDKLSTSDLIPADAFVEPCWKAIYSAADYLLRKGEPVCAESVSDHIAFHGHEREIQQFVGNTLPWQSWPDFADGSLALSGAAPLKYSLRVIADLYRERQAAAIGEQLKNKEISIQEANEALGELLHQANGRNGDFDFSKVDQLSFSHDNLHPKPTPVFMLCGQAIATPANLVVLYAQAKAGKSAVLSAMLASIMVEDELTDCLGFSSSRNPNNHALLYLDTEQPPYDFEQVILRALRRAALETRPTWLRAYNVRSLDSLTLRAFLTAELQRAKKECGGIYAVMIDGIADFVDDVNRPQESNPLIAELHSLAVQYDCVFILVIHENPGDTRDKMRGHLGSQLERKTESNVRIQKDGDDGETVIYTEKSRHANIPKSKGPRFHWDEQAQMHLSCQAKVKTASRQDHSNIIGEIFDCPLAKSQAGALRWGQIQKRLVEMEPYKTENGAKTFVDRHLIPEGWLERSESGLYWPGKGKKG